MPTILREKLPIEDLRGHPAETVAALESLLASDDTTISLDPKRRGFYEVHGEGTTYYIHVSPVSGKILLLATWPSTTRPGRAGRAA